MKKFHAYMLRCSDGTYYTDCTESIKNSMSMHNSGSGPKYTRVRQPVTLVWSREYKTKRDAMPIALKINKLPVQAKQDLATGVSLDSLFRKYPANLKPKTR